MRLFTRAEWAVLGSLLVLSFIPVFGGLLRILELSGGTTVIPENLRVTTVPLPAVIHIVGAIIFCTCGALQFLSSIQRNAPRWHRVNGGIVASAGIVAAMSGLWMTHFYPLPVELQGDLLYRVRLAVGVAMIAFILSALVAIGKGNVPLHRASMIRAYALGQGASTQSLLGIAWILLLQYEPVGLARDLMMTAAWIINVILAELVIKGLDARPNGALSRRPLTVTTGHSD